MASFVQTLHKHVVNVHLHVLSYLWTEHVIYQPLISCPCVLQTEGHYLVAKQTLVGNEGGFFLVNFVHLYLIIP